MRKCRQMCLFLIALAIGSCSSEVNTYPSLVDQGILSLSTSNPYLGANLFLSHELEQSSYLYNFFKNKGAPTAIEISKADNLHLVLFYPSSREAYAADPLERPNSAGGKTREWVVRGPYSIEREDFRTLSRMDIAHSGEPVFLIDGKQFRFRFQPEPPSVTSVKPPVNEYVPLPTPTPKKKPKVITVKKDEHKEEPKKEPEVNINFKGLSSDQMALLMVKGFAERSPNGDLIHTIKKDTETVDQIVSWYTGSEAAKEEILKINGLAPDAKPAVGTKIRIPEALVKQPKVMP